MAPKKIKRKATAEPKATEVVEEKPTQEKGSDYESDEENFLSEIKNDGDSSDEEGNDENAEEESDLESEFSFESFDGEEGSGEEESGEEDSSLGFEDDSDNYVESDEVEEEQESGNEESESEAEAIPAPELARKTMKNDKRKMIKAEKKQQKVEKKKLLEILVEQRKGERAVQKDFSQSVKEALRMPDDGFLERRERPGPSRAITEESTDDVAVEKPKKVDEYEDGVTSDEEDIRNTVGNIPMHWYDEYKHIGYDWDGNKIIKPQKRDQLDDFLKKMEDPNFWRTVKDPQTGQEVILSDDDIQLIKKIMKQRNPDQSFDEYAPWIEWFTNEVEQLPIRNIPDSKTSFLPSKNEKLKVGKLVHSLKMGWMKTKAEQDKINAMNKQPKFFMLWESDTGREKMRRIHDHVAAPKRALPGHAESYNPPPEYLFNDDEMRQWEKMNDTPYKRKLHFIPQKFKSLRQVPYYDRYIRERFLRCLDLYLCPRAKRMKVTVQPEDLIPKLPSPRDLQPFPTMENMVYRGHKNLIRTVSIEPKGQYLVTGSDDKTVKIWEVATGRCIKTIDTQDIVRSVSWCPNPKLSLIAIATGKRLLLVNPYVGDIKLISKKTDDLLAEAPTSDQVENERIKTAVQWNNSVDEAERKDGIRVIINHFQEIKQVVWHGRGDYFATVMPTGMNRSVLIHQLSKRRSQIPFSKSKGLVQCVLFHPIKPCLFVATQQHIRIYDLVKQELIKKLMPACKWISGIAIHPKGDNLLVSTYDKKMMWFDLDLSTKPYQTLKLHASAVRSVAYHLRYPLFASGSDDRGVIVCHGMVYNDLLQNPLIVPLKRLDFHERNNEFGIFEVLFHPTQPWLFSSGADHTVRLYT